MDIIEKLKDQGWYLTEEAIKKLPDDVDKSDTKKIIQTVMDMDLRGIAEGALPSEISKKNDSILGHRVLQITKIRNLSAPKANEESKVAPRFLQIELTDGVNQIFALEIDNISSISLNTPPGTKLYLRSDRIPLMQGQLVLRTNDIQILGGKVHNLIEKWEMTRTLQKYSKSGNRMMIMSGSSGPPPWIAFGQKIQQNIAGNNDKNFKSLSGTGGDKENKEKNEFDTMRSEAIAEAAKAGSKKIFGGGNQQLLDHNLKKIMEKGFTEEEARNALKANRNILEQALYNLKRRDEFKNKDMSGGKRGGFKDMKKSKSDEPVIATKPAANVSLFDFLTDKLPTNSETSDKNVSNKSDRPKSYNHDNSKPPPYHSQQSYNHQHQTSNTHYQSAVNNHQHQSHHQQQKRDQHSQQQHQQQSQSQSQSQYHQMQQQNHGNYNHANRQKFENNLSSSFATRNTNSSDQQQQQQQQPHDNYKNRDKNPQENVQNTNAYSSSRQKDSSEKYKNNQRNSNYGQNQRPNERYSGSGYQKSGAGQQQTQQQSQHQSQSQHQHQLQPQHQQQSQQSQHQHQPQQQYPQDHQSQQQQQTHTQYQVKATSSSGSYDSRNRNEYQKRNGYDTGKASSNSSRYHSKDSNSHQPTVRNYNENRQQQSNTNDSGKINKLIEETSKMKIESSSTTSRIHQQQQPQQQQQQPQQQQPQQQQQQQPQHQNSRIQSNVVVTSHHQIKPYQQHHQQQPPSQQLAPHLQQRPPSHSQHQQMQPPPQSQQPQHSIPSHTTYTQLPNGFTYDPSKIMGFQSKEANEFAMTLLKTQAAAAGAAIPPIQVAPHAAYPPPIQIPPNAFPTPQFVMPPTAAAPPQMTGPYGMTQCGGENWNWKIGDRCLAKYWDDGRYYEAEVTGVSDKTCVVLYLGYGNHEEVLKCDCLPITDAQHRPINMAKLHETHQPPPPTVAALANAAAVATVAPPTIAPQAVISATTIPAPLQPPLPPPPPASISQQHALNRGMHAAASRYRGERQMYVPPPKRDG